MQISFLSPGCLFPHLKEKEKKKIERKRKEKKKKREGEKKKERKRKGKRKKKKPARTAQSPLPERHGAGLVLRFDSRPPLPASGWGPQSPSGSSVCGPEGCSLSSKKKKAASTPAASKVAIPSAGYLGEQSGFCSTAAAAAAEPRELKCGRWVIPHPPLHPPHTRTREPLRRPACQVSR